MSEERDQSQAQGETYNPDEVLARFQDDLPPLEDLPGGESLTEFPDFPLSTHDGLLAAWSWIQDPTNADEHDPAAVERFKERIRQLARQKNVELSGS